MLTMIPVVVIVAIVSSSMVGASSSSPSSSGTEERRPRKQYYYDRSTKSTRMYERRRRVAAAIAVGDFFPPMISPVTAPGRERKSGNVNIDDSRLRGGDGAVRMSHEELLAVQAQWSAAQPTHSNSSSNTNNDNKEQNAMLRRVIQDMNSNNDNNTVLDEAGRSKRKLAWWNRGGNGDPYAIPTGLADASGTYYGEYQI